MSFSLSEEERFTKPLLRFCQRVEDILLPRKAKLKMGTLQDVRSEVYEQVSSIIKSGSLYTDSVISVENKFVDKSNCPECARKHAERMEMEKVMDFELDSDNEDDEENDDDNKPITQLTESTDVSGSITLGSSTLPSNTQTTPASSQLQFEDCTCNNEELSFRVIKWDELKEHIITIVEQVINTPESNAIIVELKNNTQQKLNVIKSELEVEQYYFEQDISKEIAKIKMKLFKSEMKLQPEITGKWIKGGSLEKRQYEELTTYKATENVNAKEQDMLLQQLDSNLGTTYLGQPYNFDDGQLTEEWMCTYEDKTTKQRLTDDTIIRIMVTQRVDQLIEQVRDVVCTDWGVLDEKPLNLEKENPSVEERLVFGIDCSCRRMIELTLIDRLGAEMCTKAALKHFIERRLLPAINAQPQKLAHSMLAVTKYMTNHVYDNSSSSAAALAYSQTSTDAANTAGTSSTTGTACPSSSSFSSTGIIYSEAEHIFSETLLIGVHEIGEDSFKIHPKGTGVICVNQEGIAAHKVVCDYLGELYPPYRWCERQDVIEQGQKHFGLKPSLPDFYNIVMERPRQDAKGYGLLFVDASMRCNMGSTLAHSCDNNCTSAVVTKEGKLSIVLTTSRYIYPGEELTHDYSAVTSSEEEWMASVCLCGMTKCRGYFLHFATQDDLQRILNQHCNPLWRYSTLLKCCSNKTLTSRDEEVLSRHGMYEIALGDTQHKSPILWMKRYAAEILRFIEYERQALPCALLRDNTDFVSTYQSADQDARAVMEQRVQSLCCASSMVNRFFDGQQAESSPLVMVNIEETVAYIWRLLGDIPECLKTHLLSNNSISNNDSSGRSNNNDMIGESNSGSKRERVHNVITIISKVLDSPTKVTSISKLQASILDVRRAVEDIVDLGTKQARLQLLVDVLSLWATTSNYSRPVHFEPKESDSIGVFARELGSKLSRKNLLDAKAKAGKNRSTKTQDFYNNKANEKMENIMIVEKENSSDHSNNSADIDNVKGQNDEIKIKKSGTTINSNSTNLSAILDENEEVYRGTMKYGSLFAFWQLMDWENAGNDEKTALPDLFGSIQLPEPRMCFGVSEAQYVESRRKEFFQMLGDEKRQSLPWSSNERIMQCFNHKVVAQQGGNDDNKIYGSPMLDVTLGGVYAVENALKLMQADKYIVKVKGSQGEGDELDQQFDDRLAPEANTQWVQCELCLQWRRLPWHVDIESLSDNWQCHENTWEPEKASCSAPQDDWDPEREDIAETNERDASVASNLKVGDDRDVLCETNNIYYIGKVEKIKEVDGVKKYEFKFKGFKKTQNEWIEDGSERIQPLNFFTSVHAKTIFEQQAWQGMKTKPTQKELQKAKKANKRALEEAEGSKKKGKKRGRGNTNNGATNRRKKKSEVEVDMSEAEEDDDDLVSVDGN